MSRQLRRLWWCLVKAGCRRALAAHILLAGLVALAGCAAAGPTSRPAVTTGADKYDPAKAFLSLEQIGPAPIPVEGSEQLDRSIPPQALERYLGGRDYYNQYRWADAITALERALQYDPGSADIHLLLGQCWWRQGSPAKASPHLKRSADLWPDQVEVHSMLGRLAWRSQDYGQAIREFRLALVCSDADWRPAEAALVRLYLGKALLEEGYIKAGIAQLERYQRDLAKPDAGLYRHPELAALLRSDGAKVAVQIGQAYVRLGWYRQAVEVYANALETGGRQRQVWTDYIRVLALSRQADQAVAEVRSLLREYPDQSGIDLMVWVYRQVGRAKRLVADLQEQVAEQQDRPQLALALAEVLYGQQRRAEAVRTLQELVQRHQEMTEAHWRLVELLQEGGQRREALAAVARAVRTTADAHASAARVLAWVSDQRRDDLVGDLQGMMRSDPDDFAVHYVAGLAGEIAGSWPLAEQALRRSVSLAAGASAGYLALGKLYVRQCKWVEAIEVAQAALRQGHRMGGVYWVLGQAYDGLDQASEAESNYQMVLRNNPRAIRVLRALAELYARTGRRAEGEGKYRQILSIDERDERVGEALFRSYVERNDLIRAQQQLAVLSRSGARAPLVVRCAALLALQGHRSPDRYRRALAMNLEDHPDEVETRYRLAEHLVSSRRYQAAFEQVSRALEVEPTHIGSRELLVGIYTAWMDYDLAAAVLDQLLTEHPNRVRWLAGRVRVCLADHRYDQAIKTLKKLADLPGEERGDLFRAMLADAYVVAGKSALAEQLLVDWLETDSRSRPALSRLLLLWRTNGQFDRAIDLNRRVLKEKPGEPLLRQELLRTYAQAERYDLAEAQLLQWLAEDPQDPGVNVQLARALMLRDRHDEAIELIRNSMAQPDRRGDFRWLLVRAYAGARQYDRAIEQIRAIMRTGPAEGAESELMGLLISAERFEQAVKLARAKMARQPESKRRMLRLLCMAYQRWGQPDSAERQLLVLYELDRQDPTISNDLGYTWADAGLKLDLAEQMIRFALGERPREPAYVDSLGWLLYKKGQFGSARDYLVRATRLPDGDDPTIYEHLGDAAWRCGRQDLARQSWLKAVELAAESSRESVSPEYGAVRQRAGRKVEMLDAGKEPQVAPVAGAAR